MLGINHTTSATAVALGGSLLLDIPFFLPLIAFVVFGSIFPDIDHGDSQISKQIPVLAPFLKHRGPTHSLLGLVIFSLVCYVLLGIHPALSYIFIFFGFIGIQFLTQILNKQVKRIKSLTGDFFSKKQFKLMLTIVSVVMFLFLIMLMFFVWNQRLSLEILVLLIVGYTVHLLGDFLTKEGVPWFWPYEKKIALSLFKTGGLIERILGVILVVLNGLLVYWFIERFGLTDGDYWWNYLGFLAEFNWAEAVKNLTNF
jgi:inner membrane protein